MPQFLPFFFPSVKKICFIVFSCTLGRPSFFNKIVLLIKEKKVV